ncbi:histidinol-phosphate transaminase [Aliifodinibius sp. S!AR15-10]|uniref:histidinol-phosphate transaminase n=1 Tax=Aliifodinibius sp. S!AR15-10 TaxID=2950437 RepID=UPI002865C646|nr:histidinol-phosphate transaminase [Aliifodinibius sp. S!AR15-10]MDR8393319.1 histidinol-phosphate transaminase [Aliifodinibius sp. S!AR15-10]
MSEKRKRPLVPPNIERLTPYEPGKTIAEVQELYNPSQISKLASNENRLGCSERVQPAVEKALSTIHDYPDPIGRKLRSKIANRHGFARENVILGYGSESLIANMCRTFFDKDEDAITSEATFANFWIYAEVQDIPVHKIPMTEGYRFDLQAMADAITEQTKLIYIANPNNPTGTFVTQEEFDAFMDRVPEDIIVVMDEAYFEYAETIHDYPDSLTYSHENLLTLRTFSKAYGLAGFRIGYGIGHRRLIDMMMKTKLTFESTALGQAAAYAAYDDTAFIEKSRKMVEKGRERIYSFFDQHNVEYVPSAANSVMMILPDAQLAQKFTQEMLKKGVILRRTHGFDLPSCIRITIGTEREMDHFESSFQELFDQIFYEKDA